jgi:hypothetical protein
MMPPFDIHTTDACTCRLVGAGVMSSTKALSDLMASVGKVAVQMEEDSVETFSTLYLGYCPIAKKKGKDLVSKAIKCVAA